MSQRLNESISFCCYVVFVVLIIVVVVVVVVIVVLRRGVTFSFSESYKSSPEVFEDMEDILKNTIAQLHTKSKRSFRGASTN